MGRASAYKKGDRQCALSLTEKVHISDNFKDPFELYLNKRSENGLRCQHRAKLLLIKQKGSTISVKNKIEEEREEQWNTSVWRRKENNNVTKNIIVISGLKSQKTGETTLYRKESKYFII